MQLKVTTQADRECKECSEESAHGWYLEVMSCDRSMWWSMLEMAVVLFFSLCQPEGHSHLAVEPRRNIEVVLCLWEW